MQLQALVGRGAAVTCHCRRIGPGMGPIFFRKSSFGARVRLFAALDGACEGCIMWAGGLGMHTLQRNAQLCVLDLCRILPCDRCAPKQQLSQGTACSKKKK